jgi:DNA mismatch endonuclease (patch repair protein)
MSKWPGNAEREHTTFGGLSRSQLMSRVRSTGNATTELRMITLLQKNRLSGWRRHLSILGKPDFTWRKERVVLFIDGCFWHGHDCGRNLAPKTNVEFWREKIERNVARDRAVSRVLRSERWTVLRVWECSLKRNPKRVARRIQRALRRESVD